MRRARVHKGTNRQKNAMRKGAPGAKRTPADRALARAARARHQASILRVPKLTSHIPNTKSPRSVRAPGGQTTRHSTRAVPTGLSFGSGRLF